MRGKKLFEQMVNGRKLSPKERKGRNVKLVDLRNECLAARYFYYGFYRNMCYEEILRLLVMEFFLTQNTIMMLIQQNAETIQLIKQKGYVLYYFQNKWPHLKW